MTTNKDQYSLFIRTQEGHCFKVLSELLQNNMKNICWDLSDDGITMQMMDLQKHILFDMKMWSENFQVFKYNFPEKNKQIGLTLKYMYSMLKSMKKKDTIELFIKKEDEGTLYIRIIPKEKNRVTTSSIKIHPIQNIIIPSPEGYTKPILIQTNDFQKMCKDMNVIGNQINLSYGETFLKFVCTMDNIFSKEVIFGDIEVEKEVFSDIFDIENLLKVIKIAGLNKNLQIYFNNGLPLYLKINIAELGYLSIYIKSKRQIETDENNVINM